MSATDQGGYQVRLEWGTAGLARLAPADVVVLVDVLGDVSDDEPPLTSLAEAARTSGAVVLRGGLVNAAAVATTCLAIQHERADRTSVAVVAAGDGARLAVEDLLGAGAVIAALSERGTDHTSPEAAVACEAFVGLRRAVVHMVAASGSGRLLTENGRADEVEAASRLDADGEVPRWDGRTWSVAGWVLARG
jgi:2-phosphosulfolactate phosphatase